ncbi:MAG: DUF2341 domain-containing protein, partial [Kiritimatiellaeota bacterium]|nr:DUF2341 domain-containing protein [Kiritimatiellota bacterium]
MKKILPTLAVFCAAVVETAHGANHIRVSFPGYDTGGETLVDFPVLVTLANGVGGSSFDLATLANDGLDLRFYDAGKNEIAYEIDTHKPGEALLVWVKVPALTSDGQAFVTAKWGNPLDDERRPCTTNGAVWAGNGFTLVHHYNETNGVAIADATPARRPGVLIANGAAAAASENAGAIGNALSCAAVLSGVKMEPPVAIGDAWTIGAWFKGLKPSSAEVGGATWRSLTRAETTAGQHHVMVNQNSDDIGTYHPGSLPGIPNFPINGFNIAPGAKLTRDNPPVWRHIMVVGQNNTTAFYLDGALIGAPGAFQASQDIEGVNINVVGG